MVNDRRHQQGHSTTSRWWECDQPCPLHHPYFPTKHSNKKKHDRQAIQWGTDTAVFQPIRGSLEPSLPLQKHQAYLQLLNMIKYIQMSLMLPFNSIITLIDNTRAWVLISALGWMRIREVFMNHSNKWVQQYYQPFCDYFFCQGETTKEKQCYFTGTIAIQ